MVVKEEWIDRASQATPVIFLDFDGTVRKGFSELGRFVNTAADVEVFPAVPDILRQFKEKGWRIVGITNQGGVALGHLTVDDLAAALLETDRQCGNVFDQISACTHHPDASDPEFAVCWCRKPRIGSLILTTTNLAQLHNEYYPPHLALFVGDRPEDKQCAENAGIRFVDAEGFRAGEWKTYCQASAYTTLSEVSI